MTTVKLGTRNISEIEIKALSVQWESYPIMVKDKLRTDKKLYLELDKENFNTLAQYYALQITGDLKEGLATKANTYYELFAVKSSNGMMNKKQWQDLYPNFDDFIDDNVSENYSYIVVVF